MSSCFMIFIFFLASYKVWYDQEDLPSVLCVVFFLEGFSFFLPSFFPLYPSFLPSKNIRISFYSLQRKKNTNWPLASGNRVIINHNVSEKKGLKSCRISLLFFVLLLLLCDQGIGRICKNFRWDNIALWKTF